MRTCMSMHVHVCNRNQGDVVRLYFSLSFYLFCIRYGWTTRNIQDEVPWCMLFVDDIVLVDETRAYF